MASCINGASSAPRSRQGQPNVTRPRASPPGVAGGSSTRRAQSSPLHACPLNVSELLQACEGLQTAQAGGYMQRSGCARALRIPAAMPSYRGVLVGVSGGKVERVSRKGNFGNEGVWLSCNPRNHWACAITLKGKFW